MQCMYRSLFLQVYGLTLIPQFFMGLSCSVSDHEFCHKIVKVAHMHPQLLCQNSLAIIVQMHKKLTLI